MLLKSMYIIYFLSMTILQQSQRDGFVGKIKPFNTFYVILITINSAVDKPLDISSL